MTTITNQTLKEKLSLGYKRKLEYLGEKNFIESVNYSIDKTFCRIKNQQGQYFTCDYAQKKADDYKEKYNIELQAFEYPHKHIDYGLKEEINALLEDKNPEPVGFYAYNADTKHHVDGFIVYDNKILVMQNSPCGGVILNVLKEHFDNDKIYVQKPIPKEKSPEGYLYSVRYDYPQSDNISCPAFAMKYLKECLKNNANLLSKTQFMQSDNGNEFILHPAIEKYSQSDTYYEKVKEDYQSIADDELIKQADEWRQKHDKTRMMYYLFKDLSNEAGYKKLEKVKEDIVNTVEKWERKHRR